jgi:hypothetical protein
MAICGRAHVRTTTASGARSTRIDMHTRTQPSGTAFGGITVGVSGGSIAVFVLLFGPILLLLTPLVALVGWARWRVGAHTVAQAVVATILAVVITVGTFWIMGVLVALPR